MRFTSLVLLLVGCGRGGDTGSDDSYTPSTYSQIGNQNAAARWRGLKLDQTSFTGFGKLSDGGLRSNVGSFVAELPSDGALHLKHRSHDSEIIVELESWGRDGDLNYPEFSIAKQGKCIEDVLGQKIKVANKAYAKRGKCLTQAEQTDVGIEAWWRGGLDSFEQGWNITEKPEGSEYLTVAFDGVTITKLQQDMVRFVDGGGKTWTYDGLNWDANGQVLMRGLSCCDGNVVIFVDDSSAQYPITVDPWFSTTGNEVLNSVVDGSGNEILGTPNNPAQTGALTSSTYRPTNGQSWDNFSTLGNTLTLTGESLGSGAFDCPYGSVSGTYYDRAWDGYTSSNWNDYNTSGYIHYRCGDLVIRVTITGVLHQHHQQHMYLVSGQQVHPLGDTNNDNYGDIIVTAPDWSGLTIQKKDVYLSFVAQPLGWRLHPSPRWSDKMTTTILVTMF